MIPHYNYNIQYTNSYIMHSFYQAQIVFFLKMYLRSYGLSDLIFKHFIVLPNHNINVFSFWNRFRLTIQIATIRLCNVTNRSSSIVHFLFDFFEPSFSEILIFHYFGWIEFFLQCLENIFYSILVKYFDFEIY